MTAVSEWCGGLATDDWQLFSGICLLSVQWRTDSCFKERNLFPLFKKVFLAPLVLPVQEAIYLLLMLDGDIKSCFFKDASLLLTAFFVINY